MECALKNVLMGSSSPFWKGLRAVKDIFFLGIEMDVKNNS